MPPAVDNNAAPPPRSRLRSALVLVGLLALVYAVAALGGLATSHGIRDWYPALAKPRWTPPPWLFGPVWTLLYTFMALVAWRVWRLPAATPRRAPVLRAWALQLALNGAWSWAFFHFRSAAAGLAIVGALFVAICWIQPRLAAIDRPAALLWTPYVLWTAFAGCLNLAVWHRN